MNCKKCFEFTGEEHFFRGHFPEAPILPGVMQLELAHKFAEECAGESLILKSVKRLKFVHIIEPKHKIVLSLTKTNEHEFEFSFKKGDELCSSGVLVY